MSPSKARALAAGALLWIASFPFAVYTGNLVPPAVSALAVWVALVPLALALRDSPPGEAFRWGYLFGFVSNGGVFFWIIVAMHKYGGLSYAASSAILLALILELALYPALTFSMTARLRGVAPAWLTGPLAFTLLEWTRVYLPLGGFPWGTPAYALYGSLPMIQIGELTGVVGLNFLVFLGNFVLAESLAAGREGARFPRTAVACFSVLFVATLAFGIFRLAAPPPEGDTSLRVGLLQGNVPQVQKRHGGPIPVLERYREMTSEAARAGADLIVWPEAALPHAASVRTERFPFLAGASGGADVVIGAPTWEGDGGRVIYRNSAFAVAPDGEVRLRYDKQHLVPYGEYVPLSGWLPLRRWVPAVAGNFAESVPPATIPAVAGHPYGILICYEVLFPDLALDAVRKGARFLVNITNDAWFDETSGPYQHVNFGSFRAIETRRPIVRAANTGITTWYDALGRRHGGTELFTQAVVLAEIRPSSGETFYLRHPQGAPFVLALLFLAAAAGVFRRHAPTVR